MANSGHETSRLELLRAQAAQVRMKAIQSISGLDLPGGFDLTGRHISCTQKVETS